MWIMNDLEKLYDLTLQQYNDLEIIHNETQDPYLKGVLNRQLTITEDMAILVEEFLHHQKKLRKTWT